MYRYEVRIYDALADKTRAIEIDADTITTALAQAVRQAGQEQESVVVYIAELDAPIEPTIEPELVDCPNHDGAFDCTPFCPICAGEQAYAPEEQAK